MYIATWKETILAESINAQEIHKIYFPLDDVNPDFIRSNGYQIYDEDIGVYECCDLILPNTEIKNGAFIVKNPNPIFKQLQGYVFFGNEVQVNHLEMDDECTFEIKPIAQYFIDAEKSVATDCP